MQIQFLPFHSSFITWTQRVALLADLALIWWLWRKILSGREVDGRPSRRSWMDGLGSFLASGRSVLLDGGDLSRRVAGRPLADWRIFPATAIDGTVDQGVPS